MTIKELCRLTEQDDKTIYRKIGKMKDKELAGHVKKIKGEGHTLDQYTKLKLSGHKQSLFAGKYQHTGCRQDNA